MADTVTIPATGSGTATPVVATDDVAGVHYQRMKISDGVADSAVHLAVVAEDVASAGGETGILAMGIRKDVPAALGADLDFTYPLFDSTGKQWIAGVYPEDTASANLDPVVVVGFKRASAPAATSGTDGDYEPLQGNAGALWTSNLGFPVSVQTDVTRPADTTAYAANDAMSDSTSAPTSGGFTLTSICRKSGGSVLITDVIVTSNNDPATPLQGEVLLFNTAVTNINDNAAFAVSDAEIKTCVGKIPFALEDVGNNDFYHAQNLNILATASGSANLRFLIRVKNAYTPASGEVVTVIVKGIQID